MIGSVNGFHLQLQKFTLHFITSDLSAFHQNCDHFEWYKIEEVFSTQWELQQLQLHHQWKPASKSLIL